VEIVVGELLQDKKSDELYRQLDDVLNKRYLDRLSEFPVVPLEASLGTSLENLSLRKLCRIVYDRNEDNLDKLTSVYSAVGNCGASCVMILKGHKTHTDIYLGVHSGASDNAKATVACDIFFNALKGNFPGMELEEIRACDKKIFAESIIREQDGFIANVIGIPSLKEKSKQEFSQGVEKIIEAIAGQDLCVILLAAPVSGKQLEDAEVQYQNFYTLLSVQEQQQVTVSFSKSESFGLGLGQGIAKWISSKIKPKTDANREIAEVAISSGGCLNREKKQSDRADVAGPRAEDFLKNLSANEGRSQQFTFKDRRIADELKSFDEQLGRIRECENYGMWNWGAYFIGQNEVSVKSGANIYSGLLRGENTGIERGAVSLWRKDDDEDKFSAVVSCLSQLQHPVLTIPECLLDSGTTTPSSLISTSELAVSMNLPKKSLPGIPVFDSVRFGRSVSTYRAPKKEQRMIEVGSVFHLGGVSEHQKVEINADLLTSHLFVTGSTGAGKSNAIYGLLTKLWNNGEKDGVPFLVIEPAKGEYKDVFGGMEYGDADKDGKKKTVQVFGTNPDRTLLLKVNPFYFPKEIHVIEHIDRLIEILNAVWPMYAAMPAILKQAVEVTYKCAGWNLRTSESNNNPSVYPGFEDLLEILPGIIEQSDYSAEMKGNYIGALVTRIQSLTNGYYRTIFTKDDLPDETLFDAPCIIDLSRVGSSETKALLMGVIFLKLQEHRMSKKQEPNAELKHITVLEEAHTLMRRTSFEQSAEGGNLQGKAVEMISNAIAEMRTHGEGFIIADQAPGLLDQSVIRNTNTKVILRLPDLEDRKLVGRAANLNDEQIEELARLRTGCAAVYQNDWQEAVLCQFDEFKVEKATRYSCPDLPETNFCSEPPRRANDRLLKLLNCRLEMRLPEKVEPIQKRQTVISSLLSFLKKWRSKGTLEVETKKDEKPIDPFVKIDLEIARLIHVSAIVRCVPKVKNRQEWKNNVLQRLFETTGEMPPELRRELIKSLFCTFARIKPNQKELWTKEVKNLEGGEKFVCQHLR
jgi:hypothetical protein